jgi:hypothetical protein
MDCDAFKRALVSAAPTPAQLGEVGLSPGSARQLIASFQLYATTETAPNTIPDRILSELFSKFDTSGVEIGMVCLAACPTETEAGWNIGKVEADDLNLDRRTGEIHAIELGTGGHVLWRCASNGGGLLAALAVAAPYLANCLTRQVVSPDLVDVHGACVSSAGGNTYSDFWAMLLGVE